jgi:hypothetical protein
VLKGRADFVLVAVLITYSNPLPKTLPYFNLTLLERRVGTAVGNFRAGNFCASLTSLKCITSHSPPSTFLPLSPFFRLQSVIHGTVNGMHPVVSYNSVNRAVYTTIILLLYSIY